MEQRGSGGRAVVGMEACHGGDGVGDPPKGDGTGWPSGCWSAGPKSQV